MAIVDLVLILAIIMGIYGLLAMALNLHWGETGIFNLAHAAFFGIGAYTSALLTTPAQQGPIFDRVVGFDFPIILGMIGAAVLTGLVGVGIALTSMKVEDDYLAVATLGLAEIIHLVIRGEGWFTGGVQGIANIDRPLANVVPISYNIFYLIFVALNLVVVYLLLQRLKASSFGRVLNAIREDEIVPRSLGKNTVAFKLKSFGLGAAVAGYAGALWAHYAHAISPSLLGADLTFLILTAIIVGGMGSYLGSIIGAVFLMSIFQSVQYIPQDIPLSQNLPHIRMILIGTILILILYYRPYGLLGDKERLMAGDS